MKLRKNLGILEPELSYRVLGILIMVKNFCKAVAKIQNPAVEVNFVIQGLNEKTGKLEPAGIKGLLDMVVKPIYEMETEDGRKIRTTGNHPYLVKQKSITGLSVLDFDTRAKNPCKKISRSTNN